MATEIIVIYAGLNVVGPHQRQILLFRECENRKFPKNSITRRRFWVATPPRVHCRTVFTMVCLDANELCHTRVDHPLVEQFTRLNLENTGAPSPKVRRDTVLKEEIIQSIDDRKDR